MELEDAEVDKLRLSRREEDRLRKAVGKKAREICRKEMEAYLNCQNGKLFSVIWKCKDEFNCMRGCTEKHTTEEAYVATKREYLRGEVQKYMDEEE